MPSKEVSIVEPSSVPELIATPASTITAEDIVIPTLYLGQRAHTQVENGNANAGDVYAAPNQDASEADVLWESGSTQPGVLIIPLHMFKSWAFSPGAGQQLEMWPFEARGRAYPDGPPLDSNDPKQRAWLTYNYMLLLPEVDPEMPYKTRFFKSSTGAAQKINGDLSRGKRNAYRLTTDERSKVGVGKWYIAQLTTVAPTDEQLTQADDLFAQLRPGLERRIQQDSAVSNAPAI